MTAFEDTAAVEELTVRAFVQPDKVQRWLSKLSNPKRRADVLERIRSVHDLDEQWFVAVDNSGARPEMIVRLEATLRSFGAASDCYVMGPGTGGPMVLGDALEAVVGRRPAIVVGVPGQLAYWEGEPPSLREILRR